MNGKDLIAVLEYAKAFGKDKPSTKRQTKKPEIDWDNVDLAEAFLKLTAKEKKIKDAKEQIEKLLKKEDKKDEKKKGMSAIHLAMWFIVTAPITGPLMLYYWAYMFSSIQGMH